MRARLEDVCERDSSNLRQADVAGRSGDYPIYGASGYIGNVDFYHQELPYVAIVKDGAGIGRTVLLPAKSSVIGNSSKGKSDSTTINQTSSGSNNTFIGIQNNHKGGKNDE